MNQENKIVKKLYKFINSELFRYIVAGATTTLVNIVVFFLMRRLNFNVALSNSIAFIFAVLWAFVLNEHYVFNTRKVGKTYQRMTKFIGMRIGSFAVDTVLLVILIDYLFVDELFSKIIVNVVVVVLNYIISKYYIFHGGKDEN